MLNPSDAIPPTVVTTTQEIGGGGAATSTSPPQPNHNRMQTPTYIPTMREMTMQHINDVYSDDSFISGGGGHAISPKPSNLSSNTPAGSPSRTEPARPVLRVNDIIKINPLESEAETLIMKAIERQDAIHQVQQTRSRANTATGSLLSNCIPNESIGIFSADGGVVKKTTFEEGNNSIITPGSFEQRSRLPPRAPPPPPSQLPKPTFERHQTTEETLAAITMAMENFQDHSTTKNSTQHVQSAAEAFAQNANILFNKKPAPNLSPKRNKGDSPQQRRPSITVVNVAPPSGLTLPSLNNVNESSTTPNTGGGAAAADVTKIGANWMKLKNAVQTSTVAELNGIDLSSDQKITEEFLNDVEIGEEIPDDGASPAPQDNALADGQSPSMRLNTHRSAANKNNPIVQALSNSAVQDLKLFIDQRRRSIALYTRLLVLLVIPAMTVSCLLFYFFDNTPTGKLDIELYRYNKTMVNTKGQKIDEHTASVSWWILFVCVRQALTFSMAQFLQVFIIDFLCLNTRFFSTLFGNLVTLLIAQSKGWPFIVFTWGLLDLALLHGTSKFASSWLYWQDYVDVFNEVNPGGKVTSSTWNSRILAIAVCVGVTVAMKRLWMGLFLGKKTYVNYADELTSVVKKALLLCEVATLARDFYYDTNGGAGRKFGMSKEALSVILHKSLPASIDNDDLEAAERQSLVDGNDDIYNGGLIVNTRQTDLLRGHLDQSQRTRIIELLGAWEEPEAEGDVHENVTISSILQFRNSLSLLDSDFMFGIAWGDVTTRAKMVVNSQEVYQRLLLPTPDSDILKFEVLARIAMRNDGTLNQGKLESLIRLLRPDRDGSLSLLDFVKSIDGVYKDMKLLRASIRNSEYIDRAFEKAFNVVFYTVVTCIILSRIGIDPIALFLSLSGLILAFAFMIGSAASKMFEGFLFILVRRPYNIGDRIHISSVESDTDPTGSAGWIVKDVTLFNTTFIYGATGERATVANGSLASSRVINMARSPKATVCIDLKFPTDAPFERVKVFEQSLRDFIKARPREWANFNGFRAGTIYSDLGYIEYTVSLSHREAWQNIIAIVNSKAEVAAFCLELSKQLELPVNTPTLPVRLTMANDNANKSMEMDSEAGKFIRSFGGTGRVQEVDVADE